MTDGQAPARILDREHPLLSTPNQITEKGLEGRAEERGLGVTGAIRAFVNLLSQ